jgi:hypothetical protein
MTVVAKVDGRLRVRRLPTPYQSAFGSSAQDDIVFFVLKYCRFFGNNSNVLPMRH